MKTTLVTLLVVAAMAGSAVARPNVLFIAVDDLNDFPTFANRYPDAKTPNLDKLAKQGTVFTNAHCQYPICRPSRASLMSGLYPWTLDYQASMKDADFQRLARKLGSDLLHSYLAKHGGYKTMAVGKILHRHVPDGSVDASGGRGLFSAGLGRLQANWPQDGTMTDWAAVDKPDEQFPDHQAATWAVQQLQEEHDKPFMLMVGFLRPHVPWYVSKKWFDLYDKAALTLPPYEPDDLDDVPDMARQTSIHPAMPRTEWAIENDQWRNILHAYLASISFVDHQVGRVLEALEASPYKDDTIVVLWSDHGYHIGEKNTFQKHSLWERSSHVPLIIAGPNLPAGRRCGRAVGLIDIYPTLVELCDLPKNTANEGRSIVPLIEDPSREWPHPAVTGWRDDNFAIQTDRYRYLRYGDGSEELYDHQHDIDEHDNLADAPHMQQIKARLRAQLDAMVDTNRGD